MKEQFDASNDREFSGDDTPDKNHELNNTHWEDITSKEQIENDLKEFIKKSLADLGLEVTSNSPERSDEFVDKFLDLVTWVKWDLDSVKNEIENALNSENTDNIENIKNTEDTEHTGNLENQENKENTEQHKQRVSVNDQLNKLNQKSLLTVFTQAQTYYKKLLLQWAQAVRDDRENEIKDELIPKAWALFPWPLGSAVRWLANKAQ